MSALQKLAIQAAAVISRLKFAMGTTAGLTLSYGLYQTLIGGNDYVRRAKNEGPEPPSSFMQNFPFEADGTVVDGARHGLKPRPGSAIYLDLAASSRCQPSVVNHDKAHAIFVWIKVKQEADFQKVACRAARIQELVKEVEAPTACCCGDQEINAGVGFGPDFYRQVKGGVPQPFTNAKHSLISGDSVGGDILIHAKSNKVELLKELSKMIVEYLPEDSVLWYETTLAHCDVDRYDPLKPDTLLGQAVNGNASVAAVTTGKGNVTVNTGNGNGGKNGNRNGGKSGNGTSKDGDKEKEVALTSTNSEEAIILNYQYAEGDMQLFPPDLPVEKDKNCLLFVKDTGTEDTEPKRRAAAVDPLTGGSYVMTQRWVHDVRLVSKKGYVFMNDWVDKAWEECAGPQGERRFKFLKLLEAELPDVSMDKWMNDAYSECLQMQEKHKHNKKKKKKEEIRCTPGIPPPHIPFRILRQSMPYKCWGQAGLFFVSYASTPKYNELLLDRLIASACGEGKLNSVCQNVFRLSRNVRSACWYFPGLQELRELE